MSGCADLSGTTFPFIRAEGCVKMQMNNLTTFKL